MSIGSDVSMDRLCAAPAFISCARHGGLLVPTQGEIALYRKQAAERFASA
jgi:hypothetical protein